MSGVSDWFTALVPEAPTNLQVAAESTTSIHVSWRSPQQTNGPIVTYKVCFGCIVISEGYFELPGRIFCGLSVWP